MTAFKSIDAAPRLFRLHARAVFNFIKTQPASFWLVNFYLFLEYVRPQSIWTSLAVLPWGQLTLILALAAVVFEGRLLRRPITLADGFLACFTGILVLSSVNAVFPSASYNAWEVFFSWVLVFVLITSTITTEKRFLIFMLGFLLYSFKMSQHGFRSWMMNGFRFRDWGVTGGPGWFQNSGEFGIQMCVFLPLCVEFILALRPYWGRLTRWFFYLLPFTAVASIVASSSRGAVVGAAAVGVWWVARTRHRVRALAAVAVLGVVTWAIVPAEQKARFGTAGEDNTSATRIERWEAGLEIAREYPLLGIGYDNWAPYYGGQLPHNIFIEAVAELGYLGLAAFLALIFATFHLNRKTRRIVRKAPSATRFITHMAHGLDGALIGYLVSGFFVTVLYYPYFWINLSMTVALHVVARGLSRSGAPGPRLVPAAMAGSRGRRLTGPARRRRT